MDRGESPSLRVDERNADERSDRYRTLVFWLYADKSVLDPRLDSRVDKMVEGGLYDEISSLWKDVHSEGTGETNYNSGVYQSIGTSSLSSPRSILTLKFQATRSSHPTSLPSLPPPPPSPNSTNCTLSSNLDSRV
jgi:hypothetical protein